MLSSGSTVMLFIVFPPQGASLRTSFAVLRSVAGFAGARGAAGACATAGGAGSGRVAIWVGGGAGGVYGTGAGPASTVSGALAFMAGAMMVASRGEASSVAVDRGLKKVDGKLKRAAPTVPTTARRARVSAIRFMDATLLTSQ